MFTGPTSAVTQPRSLKKAKPLAGPVKVTGFAAPTMFEGAPPTSWVCTVAGLALHWPATVVCPAVRKTSLLGGPVPMASICIAEVSPLAAAVRVEGPAAIPMK